MTVKTYAPYLANIPMPDRIKALPVCPTRLVPVPWFVVWVDGKPEFRIADARKPARAVRKKLCWVCGMPLDPAGTFVLGPMCVINRTSAEPPSHRDCAEFSARACPFLTKPQMERREGNLLVDINQCGHDGHMILRNPGAVALWVTREWRQFGDGRGGLLFRPGEPLDWAWFCEGRTATRAEVQASIDSGLPELQEMAIKGGPDDVKHLKECVQRAQKYLPKE